MKAKYYHNALPTIETLHATLIKKEEKVKYILFKKALEAATQKLNDYYQKTAEYDAHIHQEKPEMVMAPNCLQLG